MKKNILKHQSCLGLILFCVLNFSKSCHSCSNKKQYYLPIEKSLLISPYKRVNRNLKWNSENKNIAVIDNRGIVTGKNNGKTKISAIENNSEKFSYELNVVNQEPIRSIYSNFPDETECLKIFAITPKNISSIKFIIEGENYNKEVYSSKSKGTKKELLLWNESIEPLKAGKYTINAFYKLNNEWINCKNSKIGFNVFSKIQNFSELSLERRELSKNGINFIERLEGFSPNAYTDMASVVTIGYGKSIMPYTEFYNDLDKIEAYQDFLNKTISSGIISSVNNFLINNKIKFNQNQFDALVSFTYNLGSGWMKHSYLKNIILNNINSYGIVTSSNGIFLREHPNLNSKKLSSIYYRHKVQILNKNKVNDKWYHIKNLDNGKIGYGYADYIEVNNCPKENYSLNDINKNEFIEEFLCYHHVSKRCVKGLFNRRIKELDIFFDGNYNSRCPINKYPRPRCLK